MVITMADPVPFQELDGSPEEFFGEGGFRAQRQILVPYDQRYVMVNRLLGDNTLLGSGGIGAATYPDSAGGTVPEVVVKNTTVRPWPVAADGDQAPFTDITTEMIKYTDAADPHRRYAKITVNYEVADWAGLPAPVPHEDGTFVTYRQDFGVEYMDLPNRHLKWLSGTVDSEGNVVAVPPDAVSVLRIPVTEHHLSWHRVLNPPWRLIKELRGKINSDDWPTTVDLGGWAAETLLFEGAETETNMVGFDGNGAPLFTHSMHYLFRERTIEMKKVQGVWEAKGWNDTYRTLPADSPGWDRLVDKDTGKNLYEDSDAFSSLFAFAATS